MTNNYRNLTVNSRTKLSISDLYLLSRLSWNFNNGFNTIH